MKETLKKLSKIEAPVCVTIIARTHKTHPDNQKDGILLKNLIAEANKRLLNENGKEIAERYTKKLNSLAAEIDHNYNDHGLMLFVNDDVAEFLRLPTRVNSRVIIDETFATRSIIRALERDTHYFILALTKGKARLIETNGEELIGEVSNDDFPLENRELFSISNAESGLASRVTNLTQEFFNQVDKAVNRARKETPIPVIIYSEETNYHQYLKEADYPNTILGHVLLKNFDEKASNLAKEIWPAVKEQTLAKNRARISELETALKTGKFVSDINEIWNAIQEGKGKTIFVEENYYQAVRVDNGVYTPISYNEITSQEEIDDIVDEMIEQTLKFGGDVVFLEPNSLEKFEKLALVTRY